MFRRAAIISLVIFEAIWLNVIIPGHTRGAVTMPCGCGGESPVAAACPFCAVEKTAEKTAEKTGHHVPTPADREHCALCFFAAHLSIPPVLDLDAPKLRFLNYVGAQSSKHLFAREVILPFDGTGPPASA
jgi:hypothetical protein